LSIGGTLTHKARRFRVLFRRTNFALANLHRASTLPPLLLLRTAHSPSPFENCRQLKNDAPAKPQKRRQGGNNATPGGWGLRLQRQP